MHALMKRITLAAGYMAALMMAAGNIARKPAIQFNAAGADSSLH